MDDGINFAIASYFIYGEATGYVDQDDHFFNLAVDAGSQAVVLHFKARAAAEKWIADLVAGLESADQPEADGQPEAEAQPE